MPCFLPVFRALTLAPEMGAVLAGTENEPLEPNFARYSSRMRRELYL